MSKLFNVTFHNITPQKRNTPAPTKRNITAPMRIPKYLTYV